MNAPLAVPKTLQKRLEKIAAASRRKPEALLKTAIQNQLDYEEWVIREVKAGLTEFDHNEIVSHDDLKRALEKARVERAKKRRKAA